MGLLGSEPTREVSGAFRMPGSSASSTSSVADFRAIRLRGVSSGVLTFNVVSNWSEPNCRISTWTQSRKKSWHYTPAPAPKLPTLIRLPTRDGSRTPQRAAAEAPKDLPGVRAMPGEKVSLRRSQADLLHLPAAVAAAASVYLHG